MTALGATSIRFRVEAGCHDRVGVPVWADVSADEVGRVEAATLVDLATGAEVPVQWERRGDVVRFYWVVDWLQEGGARDYELRVGEESKFTGFSIARDDEAGRLDVSFRGRHILTYNYGPEWSKPHVFPLRGPFGLMVTETEPADHKHHRSLWVAHGDVNGVDIWSEAEGHGRIVHRGFERVARGPVYAELAELNTWVSAEGRELVDEVRTIRVWAPRDEEYYIDFTVELRAAYGDVKLADTKEAGILSIRVARSMTVKEGGGRITNSWGGVNERETWGRRAVWCDYSGEVNGVLVGIAAFDNPLNPRHPTYWHVRDYGLMTANVFGLTRFERERGLRGDMVIRRGESVVFTYRLYLHRGDAEDADVKSRYIDYVHPPMVQRA
ncbi:MAG: hypothetical protein DRJ56_05700 [Thermoprotei archaeon]|nr:MAG: hypothetical protein DRJ56_05700 [Thermoprotei archaeon]